MFLHLFLQYTLFNLFSYFFCFISHLKVHLIFLQLYQLANFNFPLFIQPLKHPIHTSLSNHKHLIFQLQIIQVQLQFRHHFLQQT